MMTPTEPKLDAPGAGLPAPELFIGRLIFHCKRLTGNRAAFNTRFVEERAAIRKLVDACPFAQRGERVLIERPRGLEDSSRYWSVWMTLDHLRITNSSFARVMTRLAQDRKIPGKADTAKVKPDPGVTAAVEAEYEASCDAVLAAVDAFPNLKTKLRYEHPWFGPLDANGWHALAGTHMGIHRGQIERIMAGMSAQ